MNTTFPITCLFVDIGGVLLNNGWDHHARQRAAEHFRLDWPQLEERHKLNFETVETGKLTLEEYLDRVVFYEPRPFTHDQFREFMFAQSLAYSEMIELMKRLKKKYLLKVAVVSNEGRELNAHRIQKFKLDEFVDVFISSCFIHVRKPDVDIFRLALDVVQTPIEQILYLENTPMFVEVASGLGINGIVHSDYESTLSKLAAVGLVLEQGVACVES